MNEKCLWGDYIYSKRLAVAKFYSGKELLEYSTDFSVENSKKV